jgi:hypothetical protein
MVPSWEEPEEFADRLGESILGRIKAELDPTEYLLWADRPLLPGSVRIPPMPALFVAVLAGLSGFSLAALFGLVGQAWVDPRMVLLALLLAPCVLGGMIVAHLISLGVRRWLKRRRLTRLVYAVTDHRAIVAQIDGPSGDLRAVSLHPGEVTDTRRFENPDGSGDLYFLGDGHDEWLPTVFLEVPQVRFVEALARETLLERDHEWWKFGTAGAG